MVDCVIYSDCVYRKNNNVCPSCCTGGGIDIIEQDKNCLSCFSFDIDQIETKRCLKGEGYKLVCEKWEPR